jgi:hypothetical protein
MTAMEHQPSPGIDDREGSSSYPRGAQAIEFTPLLNGVMKLHLHSSAR